MPRACREVVDQAFPSGRLGGGSCGDAGIGNHDRIGTGRYGNGSRNAWRGVKRDDVRVGARTQESKGLEIDGAAAFARAGGTGGEYAAGDRGQHEMR